MEIKELYEVMGVTECSAMYVRMAKNSHNIQYFQSFPPLPF